jgi:hypothetical protein
MTDKNWNVEDWFMDFPGPQPYTGPITGMPLPSKIHRVSDFLLGAIMQEAFRCVGMEAELGGLLLCLASVDYISGFFAGRKSRKQDFIDFMVLYFPPKYVPFLEAIYDQLRSGLMHNLVAMNPWLGVDNIPIRIQSKSETHLDRNSDGEVVFCVGIFLQDVKRAWVIYAHDVIMNGKERPELVSNFNRRFNKLDGKGAFMVKVPD